MKKVKKPLLIVVAMALVCVVAIAGTLAYLTAQTSAVTNTFTAAGLIENTDFKLTESKANESEEDGVGHYVLDEDDQVVGNNYTVVPGVDLPKDPRVTITGGKLEQNAYLFIEVVDSTPATLTYDITSDWIEITDAVGNNGGQIYAYNSEVSPAAADQVFFIIEDNTVVVDGEYAAPADNASEQLVFYAYLAQSAGFDDAAAAWSATFGA